MLKIKRTAISLIVFATYVFARYFVAGCPLPLRAAWPENLGPADFRQDLEFFARELPQRHKNAFHHTSKEQFEAAVRELQGRLGALDSDGFYVGVKRIAAMVGDAHTQAGLPRDLERVFPLPVSKFDDDYRIALVPPGLEKALGARIVSIDDTPAERFYSLLSPLVPQDENPTFAPAVVNLLLSQAQVLHGAGITKQTNAARYTLEDETGRQFTLDVQALGVEEYAKIIWVPIARAPRLKEISEPMHNPSPMFTYTYIPQARTVFANVRKMVDVKEPGNELIKFIRERQPEKVIIDLRANVGGDYFQGLHGLVEPISKLAEINQKGHLFVLIGPLTSSAAVINAAQFHTMTNAILVGQPIGEKPSEYAEHREMTLPRTHISVGYSVRFYDFAYNKENIVKPDHEVRYSWDDFKHGINPALEWCLAYK